MTHDATPQVLRHCDVAVIGGSAAGLAAALQLGRQRRSVIVIDSGEPRNTSATHLHSFLGRDGTSPTDLLADARRDVRSYGGEVLTGRAVEVTRLGDRFVVDLEAGHSVIARRLVAATGLADDLPDVPGVAEHWGGAVIHCPFCHGYEARDARLVQLVTHPTALHTAPLFRQLTERLTVLLHDDVEVDEAEVETLRSAGVEVRRASARRLVSADPSSITGVELTDGSEVPADAVVVGPRFHARAEALAPLGLHPEAHPTGLGDVLVIDAMGATSIEGVYAVGNVTDPSQQVLQAAAHGSRVGGIVALSLAQEDVRAATRRSSTTLDWDQRYSGDQVWSGNPNGSLVAEATSLPVGRALDVGAGEGGDAIWLAEQGWEVSATDISGQALGRIAAAATQRGVSVSCLLADANAREPFGRRAFDLVAASYASIPRTPDLRGVHNLLGAVAPGGSLVVISHDLEAMHAHRHLPFDPDAYLQIDDFVSALLGDPVWTIEVHEKRTRPPGSATAEHHVDDVVLRAVRRG